MTCTHLRRIQVSRSRSPAVASFILKEAETALKCCSRRRRRRSFPSITALLRRHRSLSNPLPRGLSSFSVSVFAPYPSLCPQGPPPPPPPFKRKIFATVCSFITSLLHSRSLGLSEEDRAWFSLLNKSIFITLPSVWRHRRKHSHTTSQRPLCHQHLPIQLELYIVEKCVFVA